MMWRLPFEIMAEIFKYCLSPGGPNYSEPSHHSYQLTASQLCLVCQHWRSIAIATPALWANLTIKAQEQHLGHHPRVKSQHVRHILKTMDRVANYPWALVVKASAKGPRPSRDENAVLLSLLLHRPASLSLKTLTVIADPLAVGMGNLCFPRVTSAVIHCSSWPENPNAVNPDLPSLPNLTHAVLANITSDKSIPTQIPWSNLTHLFLDGDTTMDIRQWRAIFKMCTSLQRGAFRSYFDISNEVAYPEPTEAVLPDLTDLAFLGASPFEEPVYGLSLPSLSKLQMYTNWNTPAWDFNHAADLYANLTHLTLISQDRVSGETWTQIFDTTPRLTELFFLIKCDIEEVCDYLTFDAEKPNLPHLKALGMYMETYKYRPPEHVNEYDGDRDDVRPFPYHSFTHLAQSRTQTIQAGLFDERECESLKHLVLRVDGLSKWAGTIAGGLRDALDREAFAGFGLKVSVFGEWVGPGGYCFRKERPLGGDPPSVGVRYFKHWSDGFGECLDHVEEYSLHPREG